MDDSKRTEGAPEFVLGMTRSWGRLAVRCSVNGREEVHSIEVLNSIGPNKGPAKVIGETDLAAWTPADPAEWAAGLGLPLPTGPVDHLVWRARVGEQHVLVPALALMRALLRPTKNVLANMFAPQALDGICSMVDGKPVPTVSWRRERELAEAATFVGPMTWMHCFPAARRMAGSVYEHAVRGTLGWDLAPARLAISMHGVAGDDLLYVTKVLISEIRTEEHPFEFASGVSPCISTRTWEQLWPDARTMPLRNGLHNLSDGEWAEIENVIPRRGNLHRRYPLRAVVDEILLNLCPGSAAGTSGEVPRKLVRHYREIWRARGVWDAVDERIRQMRESATSCLDPAETPLRKRIRQESRQAAAEEQCGVRLAHYGPFADHEWTELSKLVQMKSGPKRRPSREVWNAILKGIGDGVRWNSSDDLERTAYVRYSNLLKQGRWKAIAELLTGLRPPKSPQ